MKKNHLIVFNVIALFCFTLTSLVAQSTKKHTERFSVNEAVDIHVNTTHANVVFETWDKNEVEVTFTLEADEKVAEYFEKWKFEATEKPGAVNIRSQVGHHFDMQDFEFDFDMSDFNFEMENLNIDLSDLNLEGIDVMVTDIIDELNLESIPTSPFGEDTSFDGGEYEDNPDEYLKKLNKKYGTQVTKAEVDGWMKDLKNWGENIEVQIDESRLPELDGLEERIAERAEEIEKYVEKWEAENEEKIKAMTEEIERKMENIDWEQFEQFNSFDQDNSKVKKTIHVKMPKKAKLHLNIRYGEVTLAANLQDINANLNYASLSANTIEGKGTDISAAFAPVSIDHWKDGRLDLSHCNELLIKKINQIDLNAQGTDVVIGTLLNTGSIRSAYGDLEIQNLGNNLKDLKLVLDYGTAVIHLPREAVDLSLTGNQHSAFSLPKNCTVVSDTKKGQQRVVKAFNQKRNSGKLLSVLANYGDLNIK